MKNKNIKLLIKLVLTAGLLIWVFYNTEIKSIINAINQYNIMTILLAIMLYFIAILINSLKWYILLPSYSFWKLFKTNFISQYYSILLPGQLAGEVMKVFSIGKGKSDIGKIVSSVVIDKITGIIGLLILGIISLIILDKSKSNYIFLFFSGTIILCILCILCIRIKILYNYLLKIINNIVKKIKYFSKIFQFIITFLKAYEIYSKKSGILLLNVVMGIIFQLCAVLITYILAVTLKINISYLNWCWIYALVSMALLLPLTIGGIGIREVSFVGILNTIGITSEKSLALSFSIFGVQLLGILISRIIEGINFIRNRRNLENNKYNNK